MDKLVVYEQPLNERMRTLMRLEHLFQSVSNSINKASWWDTRYTVDGMLDILDILGRSDVKNETTKEMERVSQSLRNLATLPGVDKSLLDSVLGQMELLLGELQAVNNAQFIQVLTNSEMLAGLQRRHHIAGGKCAFDQPAYHFWLGRPAETRRLDLQDWFSPFVVLQNAITLILRLTRDSAVAETVTAEMGFLQRSLDTSQPNQMIRILLDADSPFYPEISGGKHRFSIRFLEYNGQQKSIQTDRDVEFKLMRCCL